MHFSNGPIVLTISRRFLYTLMNALLNLYASIFLEFNIAPHYFQQLSLDSPLFRAELRVDPLSRCAALSLPKHALAIVPFLQTQAELDAMDLDQIQVRYIFRFVLSFTKLKFWDRDIPFSPSFILDLPAKVDQNLRNVIDFVFLPGFNNPTIAVLFQTQQTWTGYAYSVLNILSQTNFNLQSA